MTEQQGGLLLFIVGLVPGLLLAVLLALFCLVRKADRILEQLERPARSRANNALLTPEAEGVDQVRPTRPTGAGHTPVRSDAPRNPPHGVSSGRRPAPTERVIVEHVDKREPR